MMKKSKKKVVNVKPIQNHDKIQIDIPKTFEKDKQVKPQDVFEGYKKNKSTNIKKKY
jgi:hypothetical protein